MKIGENSDIAFYLQKTRDFVPQTLENDENDENGGCHPSKTTGCQKHRFDNPEVGKSAKIQEPKRTHKAKISHEQHQRIF